jgi:hypothetical protein
MKASEEKGKRFYTENTEKDRRTQRKRERSFTRVRGFRMTGRGVTARRASKQSAHAGYYYCYVVGLFGCAGPLFGGGY